MKNKITFPTGCIFIIFGISLLYAFMWAYKGNNTWWFIKTDNSSQHAGQISLPHECYIWQRLWSNDLSASVHRAEESMSGFTALAAEIDLKGGNLKRIMVPINYEMLAPISQPVGFAIRISPYPGPFGPQEQATQYLLSTIQEVLATSEQAGFRPAEIQLDFDCAESKLQGYREWVNLIKQRFNQYSVTITALPSWMNNRKFKNLIRACDGYVLQVHSLDKPDSIKEKVKLCDKDRALKWIKKADRLGIQFRVALPTYGYFVAYDERGQFVGLSAEGPKPSWSENTQIKTLSSDADEIADLIRAIQTNCPKNLKGFIWFRLPLESDILNWRWHTLHRIIQGESLRHEIKALIEWPQPQLAEIYLLNSGDVDAATSFTVELQVSSGCLAADGVMGYVVKEQQAGRLLFASENKIPLEPIRAQEKIKIGWCRFEKEMEIKADVQTWNY